ncbi:hypothetical protein BSM4216_1847 [Bacillus smithii]|nr:hypothetical protein BSM4216_1847 [Bacillus smithii]
MASPRFFICTTFALESKERFPDFQNRREKGKMLNSFLT